MEFVIGALIVLGVIGGILAAIANAEEQSKLSQMDSKQKAAYYTSQKIKDLALTRGPCKPEVICPHCATKGTVHMQPITKKKGISGGKATGAILTGGVSLLATGLSKKEAVTQAYCRNCMVEWEI